MHYLQNIPISQLNLPFILLPSFTGYLLLLQALALVLLFFAAASAAVDVECQVLDS